MRYIDKHTPPPSLSDWKSAETVAANRHYDGSLPTNVKDDIRYNRVKDQGYLCAYTMRRINPISGKNGMTWDAHVEHVKTRKSSKDRGLLDETIDYYNMVACVDYGATLPYGASVRGDSGKDLPITPLLHNNCSSRFQFHLDGKIEGLDQGAKDTIKMLNLGHSSLNNLRQSKISALGLGISRPRTAKLKKLPKPVISATKAARIAVDILQRDANGMLPEFCVAVSQAAREHATRVNKEARKQAFARSKQLQE